MNKERTENLDLMMLSQYQTGAFFALNSNFDRIDSILNTSLKGDVINGQDSPPQNPENYLYLVGNNPSEEWGDPSGFSSSLNGMIAKSNNANGWIFIKPKNGLLLWHEDNQKLYVYSQNAFKAIVN